MAETTGASGPDLTAGVAFAEIPDGGILVGHAGGEAVLLYREGDEVTAVGGTCTHYGGPLGEGLVGEGTVRCPWHHACFSLRTGESLRAPALNPVPTWRVVREGDTVRLAEKLEPATYRPRAAGAAEPVERVVVVGFGAAGSAAVEALLRHGWGGRIDVVEPEPSAPYDRPNLSKDYLAGSAPEEWIPLRPEGWYEEHGVRVHRSAAEAVEPEARRVRLAGGGVLEYDALLLATGAAPVRLPAPGADDPRVHYLRSLADSRAIIAAAERARRAVVVGASFIGLEVAASLRARGLEVDVVAPEEVPLEHVLGRALGAAIRSLHEEHGVRFQLGRTVGRVGGSGVELDDGTSLAADLIVVGIGVRPVVELARAAGLEVADGVRVDGRLRTSVPGIWAAGDIARYPDPVSGESARIEHWVVAQRQGAAAAADMVGRGSGFSDVPFFWSQHYDVPINYVGHAPGWDEALVEGDPAARDCTVNYVKDGRRIAVATIYRDLESLEAEREMEGRARGGSWTAG